MNGAASDRDGPASTALRALAWGMTGLFALAAAVQWNDPDPLRWIGFYALAAAASLGAALGRAWRPVEIAALGVAVLAVAALALPYATRGPDPRIEAFTSFRMERPEDEGVRELAGAAIVLVWSAALVVRRARRPLALPD